MSLYKKNGKVIEAKAGRQFADDMTPARANKYRSALIEGRETTPQEQRRAKRTAKETEQSRWTISKLWDLSVKPLPKTRSSGMRATSLTTISGLNLATRNPLNSWHWM